MWAKAANNLIASSVGVVGCTYGGQHVVLKWVAMAEARNYQVDDRVLLHTWAIERGATKSQAARIQTFLDLDVLHSVPPPPRTHRKPGIEDYCWGRFLIRRHIQHVLKWTARREEGDPEGFGERLNGLIRDILFPEPVTSLCDGEDEGCGKGGGKTQCREGQETGFQQFGPGNGGCSDTELGPGAPNREHQEGGADQLGRCLGVRSADWKPRSVGGRGGEARTGGVHLGVDDTGAGEEFRYVRAPPRRHAAGVTDVTGSFQQGGDQGGPDWAGSKRRRRGSASASYGGGGTGGV